LAPPPLPLPKIAILQALSDPVEAHRLVVRPHQRLELRVAAAPMVEPLPQLALVEAHRLSTERPAAGPR